VARLSQDAAAAIIGPEPGPAYISPELTSGGNVAKSIAKTPYPAATAFAASVVAYESAPAANTVTNIW
jgi:hypothetical protein